MDGASSVRLIKKKSSRRRSSKPSKRRRKSAPIEGGRYSNRELSWLQFNARVLSQAGDKERPLLERLKFCAIYASNLDEFYMVRVAGLIGRVSAGIDKPSQDGISPSMQLERIREVVVHQSARLQQIVERDLVPQLANEGVELVSWTDLTAQERQLADSHFQERIFPILTPLAVDPGHPFPYISNLSLNLAVLVRRPDEDETSFARVKVPPTLSRFVRLKGQRFVPIEEIITQHLEELFPGLEVVGGWAFRVTRNSDISLDDEEADDLLEAVETELQRRRFGRAVRLELDVNAPQRVRSLLGEELEVAEENTVLQKILLDVTSFWEVYSLDRADLKDPPARRSVPHRMRGLEGPRDMFRRIRLQEILVHHPYESFNASVTEFVRNACKDPAVLAIKITLYRTSGDSPIVNELITAAEGGKQVVALVELKARFDERANIAWARRLEEAGVHVVYGLVGLKTHSKVTLVVRDEPDGLRRYCHIGTGNYNPKTARLYEDVGLLTADPVVGSDLSQLFNYLTGYGVKAEYDRIMVAPTFLRDQMIDLIDKEISAGSSGAIIAKMNSLVDTKLIDKFYEASQAGVSVDLIVRGICCLRPGVAGLSENIAVRSLIGRYLEHSRIFYFANGDGVGKDTIFVGSADLMPRNLDRRVEVLVSVHHPESHQRLKEILDINLADTALAWELDEFGRYHHLGGDIDSHERFADLASERAAPHQYPSKPAGFPAAKVSPASLERSIGG